MYETVLFDLDGTVIDSAEGIMNSFAYAFSRLGLPAVPRAEMGKFIGPPLLYSFETICGLSRAEAERAVEIYREYYKEKGMYEIRVYGGVGELLKKLFASGKKLVLATSKYELYAKQIIENIGLAGYFSFAAGSLTGGERGTKAEVIEYALTAVGAEKQSAVMVGDRMHDMIGAREAGIDSIGVLFGYGTREELLSHGATHIAETAEEIFEIVCRK
ncbi:MAG: HAD hydrolase-like protein [Clostridia bacterium]|nr:HAD hydrolase-like protein [Clostridia bacterium]